jgi:hypothetical protein
MATASCVKSNRFSINSVNENAWNFALIQQSLHFITKKIKQTPSWHDFHSRLLIPPASWMKHIKDVSFIIINHQQVFPAANQVFFFLLRLFSMNVLKTLYLFYGLWRCLQVQNVIDKWAVYIFQILQKDLEKTGINVDRLIW